jgi:GntR family trehalose operon transcriptional repressor
MKQIYYEIYEDLRDKILAGAYPYQTYIPSENKLVDVYECSHNTLRKALSVLRMHGFTQPIHGKGVLVIYQPQRRANFVLGDIETFKEAAARNNLNVQTKVTVFQHVKATAELAASTGFMPGDDLIHLERLRLFDGKALIRDKNYFLESAVPGLTPAIAEDSVYSYVENVLGMEITTSKRTITIDYATPNDRACMDLLDFDMLAVVRGRTFNSLGTMFECTQSRHRPDFFTFNNTAVRGY